LFSLPRPYACSWASDMELRQCSRRLTIHSSRTRFAGRLNSGVRRQTAIGSTALRLVLRATRMRRCVGHRFFGSWLAPESLRSHRLPVPVGVSTWHRVAPVLWRALVRRAIWRFIATRPNGLPHAPVRYYPFATSGLTARRSFSPARA